MLIFDAWFWNIVLAKKSTKSEVLIIGIFHIIQDCKRYSLKMDIIPFQKT